MDLQARLNLMSQLGEYITSEKNEWTEAKHFAGIQNPWFIPEFVSKACSQISENFLQKDLMEKWVKHYSVDDNIRQQKIGIVMAGNIPLVGFQDLLCCFICGHKAIVKLSSKDTTLFKAIYHFLITENEGVANYIEFGEILKNCDAYIATGSNNTGRYFDYYFGKYPNIIRRNRTSVALLKGDETTEELTLLADDIHMYFGLGCRNVTKIFVPEGYDFETLINSFSKYIFFADHHRYKNNYDYQLSILLLNNVYYMTNGATLLVENKATFSAISILNYEYYTPRTNPLEMQEMEDIQCLVGKDHTHFGAAQKPSLFDYADGVDTMEFLLGV